MQVARPRSNVQLTGFGGHMVFERSKTVDNINTINFEIRVRVFVSVHACEHWLLVSVPVFSIHNSHRFHII